MISILQASDIWLGDDILRDMELIVPNEYEYASDVTLLFRDFIEGNIRLNDLRCGKNGFLYRGIILTGFHTETPERISYRSRHKFNPRVAAYQSK